MPDFPEMLLSFALEYTTLLVCPTHPFSIIGCQKDGRSGDRAGVFKAKTEGGRSFLSLFVFKNIRVMGVTGTA